jgi:hypothetical protein
MGGRPGRDFILQNSLHAARCQRINVAGLTTVSASRQPNRCEKKGSLVTSGVQAQFGCSVRLECYTDGMKRLRRWTSESQRAGT